MNVFTSIKPPEYLPFITSLLELHCPFRKNVKKIGRMDSQYSAFMIKTTKGLAAVTRIKAPCKFVFGNRGNDRHRTWMEFVGGITIRRELVFLYRYELSIVELFELQF